MTPPLRVAMLGTLPPLRGISGYCAALALSVSRLTPVEFLSFGALYPGFIYPGGETTDETAAVPSAPGLTVRRALRWYDPAGWLAEGLRLRADVVHAQHWSLPPVPACWTVLAAAGRRGARVVLTIHNTLPHSRSPAFVPALKALCRLADGFILQSKHGVRQAVELLGLPERSVRLIPPGAGPGAPAGLDGRAARRRLGLPPAAPVVLFFGAIRPYKGVDVLLRAFALVLGPVPEARLVIAGLPWGGWGRYERLIGELGIAGRVRAFPRFIPEAEVADFFGAADLVALPYTHFDAQSGVGMAALGYGKPLIVSRLGGLADLVSDARFAVPAGDAEALADRLALCLREPAGLKRMGDDAAERARAFSWERTAAQTVAFYHELCGEVRGSAPAGRTP
jgi:glycosyltransferase involved in cell wall biosynthesis